MATMLLALLAVVGGPTASAWADDEVASGAAEEPLRSIGQVLSLPTSELDRERTVEVRGRVTFLRSHSGVIQSDGDGEAIFVMRRALTDPDEDAAVASSWMQIGLGTLLDVEGIVEPGGYAPTIVARSWRLVEQGELPTATAADIGSLFSGVSDNRRVTLQGVVQGEETNADSSTILHLETSARRLTVELPQELLPYPLPNLIDAEVRVTGVVAAFRNTRGEFIAPRLCIARPEDIDVVVPPAGPPFEAQEVPLEAIARFRLKPLKGHRLRTTGIVAFAMPGRLYLQEGRGGVLVELTPSAHAQPIFEAGDRVEVAGFLDMSRRIGGIVGAVARKVGSAEPPQPLDIQPRDIVESETAARHRGEISRSGGYDGRLIRCHGIVEAIRILPEGAIISLTDGDLPFSAELPISAAAVAGGRLVPGSELSIIGIVRLDLSQQDAGGLTRAHPAIEQVSVMVRSSSDVAIVRSPPWWTPRRLAIAVAGLITFVAGALAWVFFLHREVARQTARALAEETARREAALEYEVGLRERSRLASNLHDTILQTVTGIGFQLKACEVSHRRERADGPPAEQAEGDGVASHLAVAAKMVDHAAGQLRSTVWSLRSLPTDGRLFSEAIREMADRLSAGHDARIELLFSPAADRLPAFVAGNLLLLVQEAVHNALVHGSPRAIAITVAIEEPRGLVVANVEDDGSGFAVGSQAGPTQGHFGLAGMRERAERLGGRLTITSTAGRGTVVRAEVPLDPNRRPLPDRTLSPAEAVG